jgi:hypothetical protein
MTFAVNVLGWVGVVTLLAAYWLVSTQKATGDSRTYQGMNLLGAILVLVNSSYYGAYPSVGVNAAWIAIGAYTLAKYPPTIRGRHFEPNHVDGTAAVRETNARTSFSTATAEPREPQ